MASSWAKWAGARRLLRAPAPERSTVSRSAASSPVISSRGQQRRARSSHARPYALSRRCWISMPKSFGVSTMLRSASNSSVTGPIWPLQRDAASNAASTSEPRKRQPGSISAAAGIALSVSIRRSSRAVSLPKPVSVYPAGGSLVTIPSRSSTRHMSGEATSGSADLTLRVGSGVASNSSISWMCSVVSSIRHLASRYSTSEYGRRTSPGTVCGTLRMSFPIRPLSIAH